jgi:hypothetical protein
MSEIIDDDYKDGNGIPFMALEGEGAEAKFSLTDEAKEFLLTLDAPIAIVAIVGRYRTGKSFLVNRMLLDVLGNGFQVGSTVNSCTKGLWMWNRPLKTKGPDGSLINVLVVDTEGIGSLDADADHDAKIFALALLLSSYFIYNSVGSIDETALNNLSMVVELTKHIRTRASHESDAGEETGAEFANFFPSFLWVVRDFALMLVDEHGIPFSSKQYLERSLTPVSGFSEGVEVKNRIRRMLMAFFPNRDCATLKRPIEDENHLQKIDRAPWDQLRPEFVQQVQVLVVYCYTIVPYSPYNPPFYLCFSENFGQALRSKIYTTAPVKSLNGRNLDGSMLCSLAEAYAAALNSGTSLNIGDAWSQVRFVWRAGGKYRFDGVVSE